MSQQDMDRVPRSLEADRLGVRYLARAGIDPKEAERLLLKSSLFALLGMRRRKSNTITSSYPTFRANG